MIVLITMESPVPSAVTRLVVNKKEGRERESLSLLRFHLPIYVLLPYTNPFT